MANIKTPMLNGGAPYQDSGEPRSTFEQRLRPDPKFEAMRDRIYGSRPPARPARHIEQEAEDDQAENDAVMAEIETYVTTFILKLLAQRLAAPAPVQKTRTPVVQKGEPGTQKVKIAGRTISLHALYQQLRRDGYSGQGAATICGHYI